MAYNGNDPRCYNPCLWIDPLGRLWFFWSVMPNHAVWAVVCDDPDAVEAENGDIYIVCDRNRGSYLHSLEELYTQPREILMAKITEQDILAGQLVNPNSYLKKVVNKLGKYVGPIENPYDEWTHYTTEAYIEELEKEPNNVKLLEQIFMDCGFQSLSLNRENSHLLDRSLAQLKSGLADNDPQKRKYLIRSIVSIADIADRSGYNTVSYFGKAFKRQEGMSPGEYRIRHKKK